MPITFVLCCVPCSNGVVARQFLKPLSTSALSSCRPKVMPAVFSRNQIKITCVADLYSVSAVFCVVIRFDVAIV